MDIDWDSEKLIPLTGIMVSSNRAIYQPRSDMASLKVDDYDDDSEWTGELEDSARWPDPWKKQDLDQMRPHVLT